MEEIVAVNHKSRNQRPREEGWGECWVCLLPLPTNQKPETRNQKRLPPDPRPLERGTSVVEFALLVPILVILLAGVLELGRVLDAWVVVSNAAREGGRIAALGHPASEVQDAVVVYLSDAFGSRQDVQKPVKSDVQVVNAQGLTGGTVRVVVPAYVEIYVPLIKDLMPGNPLTVTGQIAMRLE